MPVVNINTSYQKSIKAIDILSKYMIECKNLESKYQYIVSEVIMIRLFAILETTIGDMALKIACGARYKNGVVPLTHLTCSSINDAYNKMISYNRGTRPLRYLKWTTVNDTKMCIMHILNTSDKFFVNIQNHKDLLDEMRLIRNHIAHKNAGTARKYYEVLKLIYSGNLRIAMGAFLTSIARNPLPNIDRYLLSTPIILNDISTG